MIRNIDEVERTPVMMDGASGARMAVMVGREDGVPNFAIRQFEVEPGGHTPEHSHPYEHEVYVISGGGTVLLHGERRPIKSGDVIYVEADSVHQFRASGDTGLRFLCAVPTASREGDAVPGCG